MNTVLYFFVLNPNARSCNSGSVAEPDSPGDSIFRAAWMAEPIFWVGQSRLFFRRLWLDVLGKQRRKVLFLYLLLIMNSIQFMKRMGSNTDFCKQLSFS